MQSASQWTADRWPPEPDFDPANGDFNVVSNANNDIALGITGFYGEFGSGDGSTQTIGDSVSYTLTIGLDTAVTGLAVQLNNIKRPDQANRLQQHGHLGHPGIHGRNRCRIT
ncbi:MAG: hypothetical protein ACI8T1_004004 [Verrucomicrobiales bacterium]|jgi:hypothetical protein